MERSTLIIKGRPKNLSRLVQKHITDRRGRVTTVWVRPNAIIAPQKGETHSIRDPQHIKKFVFGNRAAKKIIRSTKRKMLASVMRVIEKKYPNYQSLPLNRKLEIKSRIKDNVGKYVDNAALNIAAQNREWMNNVLGNLKNKRTRKMFRNLTGINLGRSARSTKKGIEKYISEGLTFQYNPEIKKKKKQATRSKTTNITIDPLKAVRDARVAEYMKPAAEV